VQNKVKLFSRRRTEITVYLNIPKPGDYCALSFCGSVLTCDGRIVVARDGRFTEKKAITVPS